MMNPNEIRIEMLAGIYSKDNFNNGYYEKLGILDRFESIRNSNLYALEGFQKKSILADELITKYKLEGNDLRSEVPFRELKEKVDLIFKPKGIFSFLR